MSTALILAAKTIIKNVLLKVLSEKFFEWLFFWAARMIVDSTKTTKDNEFLDKVQELYEES